MTTDPVCGMEIEEGQAKARSEYDGRTFYFCSEECKELFDEDPAAYADNIPQPGTYA